MKNPVKSEAKTLLFYNIKPMLLFVLLYSLFGVPFVNFFSKLMFDLALELAGVHYLGSATLKTVLTSLPSLLCFLGMSLVAVYMIMVETAGLFAAFAASHYHHRISMSSMFAAGFGAAVRVFLPKNWLLIPFILILMPFVGTLQLSNTSYCLNIPGFVKDFIYGNRLLSTVYIVFLVAVFLYCMLLIFSLPVFVLEGTSFYDACLRSAALMKKHLPKNCFCFFAVKLAVILMATLISFLLYKAVEVFAGRTAAEITAVANVLVILVVEPVLSLTSLMDMFFHLHDGRNIAVFSKRLGKKSVIAIVSVVAIVIIPAMVLGEKPSIAFQDELKRPEVVAHRGDSSRAPENTMPAFRRAIVDEKVKWIELDVHQTSDGVIVVSHDDSLKRIADVNSSVHATDFKTLSSYDIGYWFSPKYRGLHISTLEDVLRLCREYGVCVQVEIKPTPFDKSIEEAVLDIIDRTQTQELAYVLSLKSTPLERIKNLSPDTPTIYCMAMGIGKVENIQFADHFSIEESFASEMLVDRIHRMGKKCFVWTINDASSVQKLVDIGVDGILGDDPVMLTKALDDCSYTGGVERIVRRIFNML